MANNAIMYDTDAVFRLLERRYNLTPELIIAESCGVSPNAVAETTLDRNLYPNAPRTWSVNLN